MTWKIFHDVLKSLSMQQYTGINNVLVNLHMVHINKYKENINCNYLW